MFPHLCLFFLLQCRLQAVMLHLVVCLLQSVIISYFFLVFHDLEILEGSDILQNLIGIELNLKINLERTDKFMVLCLPTYENGLALHLFRVS